MEDIYNGTHKKNLKYNTSRGIATLPSDEKILESTVEELLLVYLNQHADKQAVVADFLDLIRAFETVDRRILLI